MAIQYARYRDFDRSLNELWRKGGKFQKAAERIYSALGRAQSGLDPLAGLQPTNQGESRIPHGVKYDLTAASRLITVQHDNYCVFVFCGDHSTCEHWLETHRGFVPVVGADMLITATYMSDAASARPKVGGAAGHSTGPLFGHLPDDVFDGLVEGLPRRTVRSIEGFESTVSDAELWTVLNDVTPPDQRSALHDVVSLLRQDKIKEAQQRADLFLGRAALLRDVPLDWLPELVDSDVIRRIRPDAPTYAEAIKRFMRTARYRDWMLFMHPEQERVVNEDFDGPAKLVGVSGSGKTCVVVQRAVRLARLYPKERILVLTINKALAALIAQLVETCCADAEVGRIDVMPFFALCRSLILEFEPQSQKLYNEVTWKINEHVDEIWQEYYRCEANNADASTMWLVHDMLLSRGWNPERYLREEIDWLRSALAPPDRNDYLDIKRVGRTVPLTRQFREAVLEGARGWEHKMKDIGVVDGLGIVEALSRYRERITPRYRAVLVDEAQDFGNVELEIVRRLVRPNDNDLFLCGDAAQAVTTKYESLQRIGMAVPGHRSRKLMLNYRNSRDVLAAAYSVLMANMTEEMIDREDFDILDPEYSAFSATTPLVLEAASLEEEIACAIRYARDVITDRAHGKACIALCGHTLLELSNFGTKVKLPVLDGRTDIENGALFLSDLEQTKGFEFDAVIVTNCAATVLPSPSCPESERFRDLARLYVAMTRAKTDLVLSWSGNPSPFLAGTEDKFLHEAWSEYLDLAQTERVGVPAKLEEHRQFGLHRKSWRAMTGSEFLYHERALGLDVDLIAKMRGLIDGVGARRSGRRIRWRNLGDAADDFLKDPTCRREWGPETGKRFEDLIRTLNGATS